MTDDAKQFEELGQALEDISADFLKKFSTNADMTSWMKALNEARNYQVPSPEQMQDLSEEELRTLSVSFYLSDKAKYAIFSPTVYAYMVDHGHIDKPASLSAGYAAYCEWMKATELKLYETAYKGTIAIDNMRDGAAARLYGI